MALLRLAFAVLVLVFGALGVLSGSVVGWSALREGQITSVYTGSDGAVETSTVARAKDPAAFWRRVGLFGILPLLVGGIAAGFAWRTLRS